MYTTENRKLFFNGELIESDANGVVVIEVNNTYKRYLLSKVIQRLSDGLPIVSNSNHSVKVLPPKKYKVIPLIGVDKNGVKYNFKSRKDAIDKTGLTRWQIEYYFRNKRQTISGWQFRNVEGDFPSKTKKNSHNAKKIIAVKNNQRFIFDSITLAHEKMKISRTQIKKCLRGYIKETSGIKFETI